MKRCWTNWTGGVLLGSLVLAGMPDEAAANLSVTNFLVADTYVQDGTKSAGGDSTILAGTLSAKICRVLVRAHGPDVPDGYTLTNATLRLYQDWTQGYSKIVDLYPLRVTWSQSAATWLSNTTTTVWAAPGLASGTDYAATLSATATTPAVNGFTAFNVTADVLAFLAGTTANHGWVIRARTETQLVRFRTIEDTTAALWPHIVYQYAATPRPGTVVTNVLLHDTQVDAGAPNTTAGSGTAFHVGSLSSKAVRGLVRGQVANVPPTAVVRSAELRCYQDYTTGGGDVIRAHRILKSWNQSEATWNSNSVSLAWSAPGLGAGSDFAATATDASYAPPLAQFVSFDVTADVKAFLAGTAADYGWVLINEVEAALPVARFRTIEYGIGAQRPVLVIRYSIPSGTQVILR